VVIGTRELMPENSAHALVIGTRNPAFFPYLKRNIDKVKAILGIAEC